MSPRKVTKRPHATAVVGTDGRPADNRANVDGMTLGARLRAARARHRLTLRTVAERSGLSRGFISQVELGLTICFYSVVSQRFHEGRL